jgi:hypothetical protein
MDCLHPTHRVISLVAVLLTAVACTDVPTDVDRPNTVVRPELAQGGGKGGGGGGGEPPGLSVEMDDAESGLTSDGSPVYADGGDVSAFIDDSGRFWFSTTAEKRPNPDRTAHVAVRDASGMVLFSGLVDVSMARTRTGVDLEALGTGQSSDVSFWVKWAVGKTKYTLRYGRECIETTELPSEMALVTRTGPDSWHLESVDGRPVRLCIQSTKGIQDTETIEPVTAHFSWTLTRN